MADSAVQTWDVNDPAPATLGGPFNLILAANAVHACTNMAGETWSSNTVLTLRQSIACAPAHTYRAFECGTDAAMHDRAARAKADGVYPAEYAATVLAALPTGQGRGLWGLSPACVMVLTVCACVYL